MLHFSHPNGYIQMQGRMREIGTEMGIGERREGGTKWGWKRSGNEMRGRMGGEAEWKGIQNGWGAGMGWEKAWEGMGRVEGGERERG